MKVISMRDFRNEQTKYLKMAKKGEDIILKSRSEGSFRLKPITDNDSLMTKEEFYAKIKNGLKQIENGEVYDMLPNETTDEFIDRLLCIE
ncbi:MAG: prevent-host-death family protein [Bacteroidetes bacterium]|nr:MAG: prevent-host-death family protein [Bacteroidota bacterium]